MTSLSLEIKQQTFESNRHKAVLNLMLTNNLVLDGINEFFKLHDITYQQFNVLRILKGRYPNPCTAKYIKQVMIFKAPDLTRLLDRLINKGLAERRTCKQNRRKLDITITALGSDLLEALNPLLKNIIDQLVDLTDSEAEDLSNLLDKLRGGIEYKPECK